MSATSLDDEPITNADEPVELAAASVCDDAFAVGEHAALGLETLPGWSAPTPYRRESSAQAPVRGVDALLPDVRPEHRRRDGDGPHHEASPERGAYRREATIDDDERVRIWETHKHPWRAICHLRIHATDGDEFIGTGWLIGPRTVVTAGHCVYLPEIGGWADKVVVSPARNGRDRPFSSVAATQFNTVRGWTERGKREHDYAVITLPEDQALPELGCLAYGIYETSTLVSSYFNLAGYPHDKDEGTTLWWSARRGRQVLPQVIYYDADTAAGQSGAPVWRLDPRTGRRVVVGIHTNGARTGNSAVRISRAVFRNLRRWTV